MVAPSIEGTYQLVRRELPDGTVQLPPAVKGMITYTKEFRNFSVVWKDNEGRFYSECYVARYTLTDKEYAETSEYLIVDDQIGGKGISYDLSNTTRQVPGVHRSCFPKPSPSNGTVTPNPRLRRNGMSSSRYRNPARTITSASGGNTCMICFWTRRAQARRSLFRIAFSVRS
jgi:hypothetical protein